MASRAVGARRVGDRDQPGDRRRSPRSSAVCPFSASSRRARSRTRRWSMPACARSRGFPTGTPSAPRPSRGAGGPAILSNVSPSRDASPRSGYWFTMASAKGCSSSRSTAAVQSKELRLGGASEPATTSVRAGSPRVRVPGLSMHDPGDARAFFERDRVLEEDAAPGAEPVPTMTAVGVARPRASGQVMTTTVMAKRRAIERVAAGSHVQTRSDQPADECDEDQPERGAVGEPLTRRLEFCACWTSSRSGRARCPSRRRWPGRAASRSLIVAPITAITRLFETGSFSGDHRLVDARSRPRRPRRRPAPSRRAG